MQIEPWKQVEIINDTFGIENTQKYLDGQAEHGGDFFEKPTIKAMREEATDQINYTHVLIRHQAELLIKFDAVLGMEMPVLTRVAVLELRRLVHDL